MTGLFAATEATGDGGNLTVEVAESLTLQDGAQISTSTLGQGNASNLTVSARDIELFGGVNLTESLADITAKGNGGNLFDVLYGGKYTGLFAYTIVTGNGGDLTVEAESLMLRDGAQIYATTLSQGDAGNLNIYARSLTLQDKAEISVEALFEAIGAAGNVTINTETLNLRNEAQITVSSKSRRPAGESLRNSSQNATQNATGDLIINSNNIRLENQASLQAETQAGDKGMITINNNKDLILHDKSKITTNATGTATGGNITIKTENLVAPDNSDISANAEEASGGRVNITATGIFGTEFRPDQTEKSDITATSELGPQFNGEVNINTPDVDPSDGLIEFDDTIPDVSNLLNQNLCQQGKTANSLSHKEEAYHRIAKTPSLPNTFGKTQKPQLLLQQPLFHQTKNSLKHKVGYPILKALN